MNFALNHMTLATRSFDECLSIASKTGCTGVELRIDLVDPLFSGATPSEAAKAANALNLSLYAIAEISRFNDWTDERDAQADALISQATACGAGAVVLIPTNDGTEESDALRHQRLMVALIALKPKLQAAGIKGLVEPLGFTSSSLRLKADAIRAIEDVQGEEVFGLVHDTFHHTLAGEQTFYPDWTKMVHISGVTDPSVSTEDLTDAHRIFVDGDDRLGNTAQIRALLDGGYTGPLSFELFAPEVHALAEPADAILESIQYLKSSIRA